MAKQINQNRCIQCNACLPDSPNEGITIVNAVYIVDPRLCAECAGMYAKSLCGSVISTDSAEERHSREETEARISRAADLHPGRFPRD